jgi:hypothetical protein
VEIMPRRLEDIISRKGNPTKYKPEEQYTQWVFSRPKIVSIKSQFNINIHAGSFYVALTLYVEFLHIRLIRTLYIRHQQISHVFEY